MKDVTWSHSRLNVILDDPMAYYLGYVQHIHTKQEKPAFDIGSVFHWLMEHDTLDLTDYIKEQYPSRPDMPETPNMCMAKAMAMGFFLQKEKIYAELLKDFETGNILTIKEEHHEFELTAEIPSKKYQIFHKFLGIIDLLFLTDKGWILVDYKTSSDIPDFDKYKDQLYRYIYLLNQYTPDIPVYKIAIINVVKAKSKIKNGECPESYYTRLAVDYKTDPDKVNLFIFDPSTVDKDAVARYSRNLIDMLDFAKTVLDNELWFINFHHAIGEYGRSEYWDIYYEKPGAWFLYKKRDHIYNAELEEFQEERDCIEIDTQTLSIHNILNTYDQFLSVLEKCFEQGIIDKDLIFTFIKTNYVTDDALLETYWLTFLKDSEQ